MGRKSFLDQIQDWPAEDRLARAKSCVETMTYKAEVITALREFNIAAFTSGKLAGQIPRSRAANAFNLFRRSMQNYEIIQILALWDKPDDNCNSIPTAVSLIKHNSVVDLISKETKVARTNWPIHTLNPHPDLKARKTIEEISKQHHLELAEEHAAKGAKSIESVVASVNKKFDENTHELLRNARDHIAHSLSYTKREKSVGGRLAMPTFANVEDLHNQTIKIIEELYCWVNGTSFSIDEECRNNTRRQAEELWHNCSFSFPGIDKS